MLDIDWIFQFAKNKIEPTVSKAQNDVHFGSNTVSLDQLDYSSGSEDFEPVLNIHAIDVRNVGRLETRLLRPTLAEKKIFNRLEAGHEELFYTMLIRMISFIDPNKEIILDMLKSRLGYKTAGDEEHLDEGRTLFFQFLNEITNKHKYERQLFCQFLMVMIVRFKLYFPENEKPYLLDAEDVKEKIAEVRVMLAEPIQNSYDPLELSSFVKIIKFLRLPNIKNCLGYHDGDDSPERHNLKCSMKCERDKGCKGYNLWKHWHTCE